MTKKRGFAAMDKDRQREIARKGGAATPDASRSFSRNHDLAVEAGRKGGMTPRGKAKRDSV